MNLSKHQIEVRAAIEKMGQCFNRNSWPTDSQIETYAETLENFTSDQIVFAFNQVILSGTDFFPSLGRIISYLKPVQPDSEDQAALIVKEIVDKTLYHGIHELQKAYESLSPTAQRVAGNTRFLSEICNSTEDTLPTIKAQIRRQAKASIESVKAISHNKQLAQIGIVSDNVIEFKKEGLKQVQFDDFIPGA